MTETSPKRHAIVLCAFGSRGDVQPLVTVLEALCNKCQNVASVVITHTQHQGWLVDWIAARGLQHVDLHYISTPVIVYPSSNQQLPDNIRRCNQDHRHRLECTNSIYTWLLAHAPHPSTSVLILHNLFSLEACCIAEALRVPSVCLSPSQPPYACPPLLATALHKELVDNKSVDCTIHHGGEHHTWETHHTRETHHTTDTQTYKDALLHWLWPLCTDTWGDWRQCSMLLPVLPCLTYPPMLVYGMSTTLVPPQAWSSGVHQTSHWNTPHSTVHTNVHTNQAVHTAAAPFIAHLNTLQQGPSHTLAQLDAWQQGPSHTVAIDFGAMWDVMGQQAQAVVAAVKHVAGEHGWRVLVLRGSMIAGEHGAVAGGHGDVDAVSEIRYTDSSATSSHIHIHDPLPHALTLQHCDLVLHHGGSGIVTVAASMGVPQLVLPQMFDQFVWAERLEWLGIGRRLVSSAPLPPQLAHALAWAIQPSVRQQCAAVQSDIATEGNGAEQAADLVLQWWNEVVVSDKTDKTKEGVSNKTDKTDKGKTPQDNTKSEGGMDAGRRDGRAHWTVQMERLKPYVLDLQDTLTVAPGIVALPLRLPNAVRILTTSPFEAWVIHDELHHPVYGYLSLVGALPTHDAVVLDIGANVGLFALQVVRMYPHAAKVVAVEAVAPNVIMLRANTAHVPAIHVVHGALVDNTTTTGPTIPLTWSPDMPGNATAVPHMAVPDMPASPMYPGPLVLDCPVHQFASIWHTSNLTHCDLLKIDVEGMEMDVLKGIPRELWAQICRVVVEVHEETTVKQVVQVLETQGGFVHVRHVQGQTGSRNCLVVAHP